MKHNDRPEPAQSRENRTELAEVRQYIEQHYHEPLTIAPLAEMARLSPKYFVELFKKTYGQSVMELVTSLRIAKAKRYLQESDLRLREIAEKVGYSDEFYFSRRFKKEVGMSPSSFAKHAHPNVAVCAPSLIGQLLALGLPPAAAPLSAKWTPYYYNTCRQQIQTHLPYRLNGEVDTGSLPKTKPDLIIGFETMSSEEKAAFNEYARCLFLPQGVNWRDELHEIARFVGREKQAETWIEEYEMNVRAAKARLSPIIGTEPLAVLRIYEDSLYMYCNPGIMAVLYEDLQLAPAAQVSDYCNREITLEELSRLDPTRILVLVCPEHNSRTYWLSLQHQALWRGLQAVQQGRVYPIHSDPWFESSAIGAERMLDELLLLLTGYSPSSLQNIVHVSLHSHDL